MATYRIELEQFEGPLDLLLFFIRRDELDIYDIPISQITHEFLSYVRLMEEIDLDGVGDFIYMASILIGIKAQMLLPQPESGADGEPVDPRRELVERLLEYVRYKEAAAELETRHDRRHELFTRPEKAVRSALETDGAPRLTNATVFRLIGSLRGLLTREAPAEDPTHTVDRVHYSVDEARDAIRERLQQTVRFSFIEALRQEPRGKIIAHFLAVLELVRQGTIAIIDVPSRTEFFVSRPDADASAVAPTPSSSSTA